MIDLKRDNRGIKFDLQTHLHSAFKYKPSQCLHLMDTPPINLALST